MLSNNMLGVITSLVGIAVAKERRTKKNKPDILANGAGGGETGAGFRVLTDTDVPGRVLKTTYEEN